MLQQLRRLFAVFAGILAFVISISFTAAFAQFVELDYQPENPAAWVLQQGDWIIANVEENTLQFVREDASKMSTKVAIGSGINSGGKIHYMGLSYYPTTPEDVWEIRSKHQQNWYSVFGSEESDEQLFLRLYHVNGKQRVRSHYGIHTTPEVERIFEEEKGFGTWGCLLARYDLLKMIEELYELNGKVVKVITTKKQVREVIAQLEVL